MQKALADDFPFDLTQLIDGVAPNERKMKNVFGFFFPRSSGRETNSSADKHAIVSFYVIQELTHLNIHTHTHVRTHTRSVSFSGSDTRTYVAAVLTDGVRGGPHLPKCLRWTDCGGVMNG